MSCKAPTASDKVVFQAPGAVASASIGRQIKVTIQTINAVSMKVRG